MVGGVARHLIVMAWRTKSEHDTIWFHVWPLPLVRCKDLLAERFDVEPDNDWEPRYNIAPTQNIPVIRQHPEQPKRLGSRMRWGLIPFWAKDPSIGFKMINARAETVATKPAFREALLLPQALGVGARSAEPRCHQ